MRQKNRKLLLACYYSIDGTAGKNKGNPNVMSSSSGFRSYNSLYDLLPELSQGGIRSLVNQHVKAGFLRKVLISGNSVFQLTMAGRYVLQEMYPLLQTQRSKPAKADKNSSGELLILKKASHKDPGFVKLRAQLESYSYQSITRGVYWFESGVNPELVDHFVKNYGAEILVAKISHFSLGFLPEDVNLKKVAKNSLESISQSVNDLRQLLREISDKKALSFKDTAQFATIFDQLAKVMEDTRLQPQELKQLNQHILQAYEHFNSIIENLYFSRL